MLYGTGNEVDGFNRPLFYDSGLLYRENGQLKPLSKLAELVLINFYKNINQFTGVDSFKDNTQRDYQLQEQFYEVLSNY